MNDSAVPPAPAAPAESPATTLAAPPAATPEPGAAPPAPGLPLEIELTLAGPPKDLARAFALQRPADLEADGGRPARRLHSVYYDTADQALRRAGLGLRVRKVGRRFVQTLKSNDAGALLARGEWEVWVSGLEPDPTAFTDPSAQARLAALLGSPGGGQPLVAVFATKVRRRTRVLRDPASGTRIEMALDDGALETLSGAEPIAELELELLEGDRRLVWRVAQALLDTAALTPQWQSKAARGYVLAAGTPPPIAKRAVPALAAGDTVAEAMTRILAACYAQWAGNLAAAMDGRDPEGVHQLRVALRRLRSAFGIFRSVVPAGTLDALRREVGWLAGELGPARDWDVFAGEGMAPLDRAFADDAALQRLGGAVAAAREAGYARARAALGGRRHTALMLAFGAWLDDAGWRQTPEASDGADEPPDAAAAAVADGPVGAFARDRLARRHRKALKAGRRFDRLSDEDRHQLRIELKKLRYVAEFFAPLYRAKRTKPYLRALSRLQDHLGRLNDLAVAEARLVTLVDERGGSDAGERRSLAMAAGRVLGWHQHIAVVERAGLAAEWRAFAKAPPFW